MRQVAFRLRCPKNTAAVNSRIKYLEVVGLFRDNVLVVA